MILKKLKNRATGWRPLVLHWRRRRVLRPILKKERVSSSVSISYFPQVHFHFTTHVSYQNYRRAVQRIFSPTTVYRDRVLRERRVETRMNTHSVSRTLQVGALRINHTSGPGFFKHEALHASSKQSVPIRRIPQPRASASFKSVFTTRQSTNREELTKVSKTHSHISERRTQVLSYRSASHETFLKTDRAEELVWRRTQSRTPAIENVPVANVTQTVHQQTVRTPAVSTHVQSASASSNQATTPLQITKLDPGLVDRLTEDVIRRVEKRALIERQRRGL